MNNNYRGVTPLKKRRNKITFNAAIVLCIIVFIIGILCGKAGTSNKQNEEAAKRIAEIEQEYEVELTRLQKENSVYKDENKELNGKLAKAEADIAAIEKANEETQAEAAQEEETYETEVEEPETEETEAENTKKSGSLLRKIIIICLVIVVILCILLGVSIILKKNNDDDDDEEYDDEEYDNIDDDIEYIEESYNDENE